MIRALHADGLVPGDAPSFRDGALILGDAGEVLDVGRADAVLPRHAGAQVERIDGVLFPGLVNAHTHLELSGLHTRVPARPEQGFAGWAARMLDQRAKLDQATSEHAVERAVAGLVQLATVAVGDVGNGLSSVAALGRHGLVGSVFHEVFGLARDAALARVAELADSASAHAFAPGLTWAPAPHALHTLHPDAVRAVLARARQLGARTSLHLAEHDAEREALERGTGPMLEFFAARGALASAFPWPGVGPIAYAAELGALACDVLLVHLTCVRPEELERIADAGAPVALCPRSNLWIEGRLPPLEAMLAAGLEPALGTDSLASSDSLDVLDEAATLVGHGLASADTVLRMATWNGARALALPSVGRFARGARPGVFVVAGRPAGSPAAHLLEHRARLRVRLDASLPPDHGSPPA